MILLTKGSLTPVRKIPLETMSLQLKERDSTATMVPLNMTGIKIGAWVKDEGKPGDGIVWRVRSISQAYATKTPTVTLEHAISILKDQILFGEHKAEQIKGKKGAKDCTAKEAANYILSNCPEWKLGKFDYASVKNPYKFDGDTLFEALQKVTDSLEDAWWSYDFSSYPFKLNITKMSTDVDSELRAGRNITAITRNVDKSGMFTRFYPIGKNNLKLDGKGYVERNASTYGVVSKVETDQSIDSKDELKRWANERLRKHAQPTVTVEVDGLELADATKEKMDRLTLGTQCRIPLPEFDTTITERIVSLQYQDKLNQPELVRITLANTKNDIAKILADVIRGGGGGGRAAAKEREEDMAWFEDTNDHVAMCAKGIVGTDKDGNPDWTRLTRLVVDGNGLDSTVTTIKGDVKDAESRIRQTEKDITAEVKQRKAEDKELSGKIKVQSSKISLVVTEKNGKDVVNTAKIVAGINDQTGSYVKIKAKTINLDGYVKAKELEALSGKISNLMTGETTAAYLRATTGNFSSCNAYTVSCTNMNATYIKGRAAYWRTIIDGQGNSVTVLAG